MKCPKGHPVGTLFKNIACGPDACADDIQPWDPKTVKAPPRLKKELQLPIPHGQVNKAAKAIEKNLKYEGLGEELTKEAETEVDRMKKQIGRYEARKAFLKTPDVSKLTAEESKDYVQKKLDSLAPEAVARIEFNLKLGDEDVSTKAAYEILDRTGFGRKDGGGLPGAPIIIQIPNKDGTVQTTTTYKPAWMVDAKKEPK